MDSIEGISYKYSYPWDVEICRGIGSTVWGLQRRVVYGGTFYIVI